MEKTTKMVEEITEKRKMTKEVKENLIKNIFYNFLVAIAIMLYICTIDVVYIFAKQEIATIALKVFPMIFIFLTVGIFETAYRKESGKIAIHGVEFLFFSIVVLYMPKMYVNLEQIFSQVFLLTPVFCATYYVAKSIIIYVKTEKEYQNSLSDVKEILREEVEV